MTIDNNHFNELEVSLDDKDFVQSVKPTLAYKKCMTCKRNQPISYFIPDARAKDGYEKTCAECKKEMYDARKALGGNTRQRLRVANYTPAVASASKVTYAPKSGAVQAPAQITTRVVPSSDIKDVLEMVEWAYSTLTFAQRRTLVRMLGVLDEDKE